MSFKTFNLNLVHIPELPVEHKRQCCEYDWNVLTSISCFLINEFRHKVELKDKERKCP